MRFRVTLYFSQETEIIEKTKLWYVTKAEFDSRKIANYASCFRAKLLQQNCNQKWLTVAYAIRMNRCHYTLFVKIYACEI